MAKIELKNVTKSYGAVQVIKGIDLTIEKGEFMVFVGPSGCGKSTLLRLISGLEEITTGDMTFDGEKVNNLIAEIAAASQEQSSRIGQVSTAVHQMDRVVQQNAALVEEATAATESMKEQAGSLLDMVSRFRLGDAQAIAPQMPPPTKAGGPNGAGGPPPAPAPAALRGRKTPYLNAP